MAEYAHANTAGLQFPLPMCTKKKKNLFKPRRRELRNTKGTVVRGQPRGDAGGRATVKAAGRLPRVRKSFRDCSETATKGNSKHFVGCEKAAEKGRERNPGAADAGLSKAQREISELQAGP